MHNPIPLALTILFAFIPFCWANWSSGKAAQINFYTDTKCSAYTGEVAAYWNAFPNPGVIGSTAGAAKAQCFTLNMPGNSQSINTAALWGFSTSTEPGRASGFCEFWDGFSCDGNTASSDFGSGASLPTCQPARSKDGWLWKSAKCLLN
ncbi:hypothetical protein R3P38DRAFT_3464536 [Favolaschia claudopus]|uniref:Uncharacterized protein n=1 Tax=Favolaschia claudopus TaxID=2862362 RepID=A0AAV9ZFK7_9AGAR